MKLGKKILHAKQRLRMIPGFLVLALLLLCGETQASTGLEVHFLNVGQGDSTLIRCGAHAMLIDAGGEDDREPVLNYILNKQGLERLDYVIGTHPHEDHIGSLDAVIDAVEVGDVLLPEVTANTDTFLEVLTSIENKGLEITIPEPGEVYALGDAFFTVLGPCADYGDELNDWSIAVKVTYGNNSFVFTGDAEAQAEKDMVSSGLDLSADVLQAGHHGSSTSNTNALLDAVSPDYAVISCGAGNSYGHTNQEALDRFASHGVQIYRTDELGTVVASSDGSSIQWKKGAEVREASVPEEAAQEEKVQETLVEQTVYITETGEKYHSAGCRYLKKPDISISLSDAKNQGYTACSKCSPPS